MPEPVRKVIVPLYGEKIIPFCKEAAVTLYAEFANIKDALLRRRNRLVPPPQLIFIGAGDFTRTGEEFLRHFIELGGLRPDHKVLDVGCGIGRMALPLTNYLDRGSYDGFDIVAPGINWCRRRYTPQYPNFHFYLADVYNKQYRPRGKYPASQYRFPFANEYFDFVFLTSVFTHMLPRDMENYLSEIARVLKKGQRCVITWFLLNAESRGLIEAGKGEVHFKYERDGYATTNQEMPEDAIAYDEVTVRELYVKLGLEIIEPIRYGAWCGRPDFLTYQDLVVAVKK